MGPYQVGEVDENGFVCIGIEERKVRNGASQLNKTMIYKDGGLSESDYSSSEDYPSGEASKEGNTSMTSQYKKSLDFLLEQGVRIKD